MISRKGGENAKGGRQEVQGKAAAFSFGLLTSPLGQVIPLRRRGDAFTSPRRSDVDFIVKRRTRAADPEAACSAPVMLLPQGGRSIYDPAIDIDLR